MVSPTILKGRRISQINGSKKTKANASGQQSAKSMNQRIIAAIVFICTALSIVTPETKKAIEIWIQSINHKAFSKMYSYVHDGVQ